ncbi:MAG TPA: glycosyltransferase family 2 protein [Candidatus Limnocylindria bacterium]|nr:glycosyltransferase family 2 protein [Candidatus Limnocylindria bacterium]
MLSYVLITPARNEADLIEATIRSVIAQTVRPLRWIIVSDGSTDGTDDIVKRYAAEHPWIELLRMPERRDRQFAAKAHAFNAGYARLKEWETLPTSSSVIRHPSFDLIGNLDADITFDPDYYAFLLARFAERPRLGVVGTPFVEDFDRPDAHTYDHENANINHVSGAVQFFRRACFEQVGGYIPVKGGAIDWIAVTTARMKGWETRTFTDKVCFHHRKLGTGTGVNGALRMRFHYGRKAYYVGGHPLWEISRGIFAMRRKPLIFGGAFFIAGYVWAAVCRIPRPVSDELIKFHRGEQMTRFRKVFQRSQSLHPKPAAANLS